jgi:hypothetical protein
MKNSSFDTEQAQYALGVTIDSIQNACSQLLQCKDELELLEETPEIRDQIEVVMLRLDTLIKVERYLLNPLQETYRKIGERTDILQPGGLITNSEEMNKDFVSSVLQGLVQ